MVEEFAFDNTEERRKSRQNGTGWIEVIAGSMFSGKSEELIRRLNRARTEDRRPLFHRRDRFTFRSETHFSTRFKNERDDG